MQTIRISDGRFLKSALALLAAWVLAFTGCDESGIDNSHAQLEGNVTLNGAAVESGRINFMPSAGTPGKPVSADINAGRYIADEVPLGSVTVTFAITRETGKLIAEGDREPYPEVVSIVPQKYAQGIPLQVSGDNAAQDFTLTHRENMR